MHDSSPLSALVSLLLKTAAAEHWSSLHGPERDCGLFAALRADGLSFRASSRSAGGSLCLALFAMLGIVYKLFGVKKDLFVSGKNKVFPADDTLQDPIYKLHLRLSETGLTGGARSFKQLVWPVARITYVNSRLGPEPHHISSGDSRASKRIGRPELIIARFWGLRDGLNVQWSFA